MPSQRVNIELCCVITVSADKLAPNMLDNFGIIVVLSVIASLPHFIAESRPALLAGVTMEFQLVQNSIDTERYSDQYRYTKDELLSLRNTSHSRLPDNVFARIKELGIDKRRGRRAGSHKWRKIAVVEGRRRRTPKPPGVRAPQLIPIKTITTGYGTGAFAPGIAEIGTTVYRTTHNIIKSHAWAYHTYNDTYRATQMGQVGITLNSDFVEPWDRTNASSVEAHDRQLNFNLGWFAHAIYKNGDYPEVMKTKIAAKSIAQGFNQSRLPEFTDEEKAMIKGTGDFFGLNHYTSNYAIAVPEYLANPPSYWTDSDVGSWQDEAWPGSGSEWLKIVPWGIRRLVKWVHDEYQVPIYVTENGVSTHDVYELDDKIRQDYYRAYINELLKAVVLDGSDVRGYTAWSLLDNFEWGAGYSERFGMHYVNFSDPARPREAKTSATMYAEIISNNGFLPENLITSPSPTTSGATSTTNGSIIAVIIVAAVFVSAFDMVTKT